MTAPALSEPLKASSSHAFARQVSNRGFQPLYHAGEPNRCPGCGGQHWHVGRMSAECATCATAIPLADVAAQPMEPLFTVTRSATAGKFPRMQNDG
ncbi:hypothetical protein C7451_106101 [Blastomonas natatoria]|uniref:Uncharacterized protein n=1 Tax=Blastomonas natatoria TaxID=34015 RepID=A0A2V3V2P2_9SPHN|nr:hypothetical protein [Blastomonas natatoria]PXW75937.1 hypothetical protein C7451_106101 [Blastomonas natatoria]